MSPPPQFPYALGHPYGDEVRGVVAVSVFPLLMLPHSGDFTR